MNTYTISTRYQNYYTDNPGTALVFFNNNDGADYFVQGDFIYSNGTYPASSTNPPILTDPPSSTNPPGGGCGTSNWYNLTIPVSCNTTNEWGWDKDTICISEGYCVGNSYLPAPISPPSGTDLPGGGETHAGRARGSNGNERMNLIIDNYTREFMRLYGRIIAAVTGLTAAGYIAAVL